MQDNSSGLVRAALREDLGERGDVTTRFFVPRGIRLSGDVVAKQAGVICGTMIASSVFRRVDPRCRVRILIRDGRRAKPGQTVMRVTGGPGILTAERTALNFLQHLSGIATLTEQYAARVRGTNAKIYDTRKTLPGWRELEKYAVRCGGGKNHRRGLYDAILVKDNHWNRQGDLALAVMTLRRKHPRMTLEIEATTMAQVASALKAKADIILLDNMGLARLKEAIKHIRGLNPETEIEISGGVNLKNLRALARLGPDRISVGRITHSAPALDLSLEVK